MRRMKAVGAGLAAAVATVGLVLVLTAQVPPGKLPGLVSTDPFPKGCVDCHKMQPDGKSDYRLSTALKALDIGGGKKHPDITAVVKEVPTGCTMCHKAGTAAGLISTRVHEAHYKAKADSVFVKAYGGECLNCHTLDQTTFEMKVKSGAKNW
jgi:hypothetical protein